MADMGRQWRKGIALKKEYFVVVPEQIIAQDLAHAIRAFDEQAEVRLFRRADEALAALAGGRPSAMLLHVDPRRFVNSALGRLVAEEGIPVAFLGTVAEALSDGKAVLASPFTEATVAQLLRRLLGVSAEDDV